MKPIYKGMILCPLNLKTYEENICKSVSAGKSHGRMINAGSLFPPIMFISAKNSAASYNNPVKHFS